MPQLCVITGAGASFAAAGASTASSSLISEGWMPPLTNELFSSRDYFDPILSKYPQAHPLIHRIRGWVASESKVSLESRLSKVYRSGNPQERRQLKYLTYYLRHLIYQVSIHYMPGSPSHYGRLVDEILRRGIDVLFLTLNYDLFLEEVLESYESVGFNRVEDYVLKDRTWSLVKLHGSVNWGRKLLKQPHGRSNRLTPESQLIIDELDLDQGLDEEVVVAVKGGYDLPLDTTNSLLLYPAMVIPIEDKYEFVCPAEHVRKAETFLKTCPNFLVVGCSMKDQDICDLLSENVSKVRKLLINSSSDQGCQDTQSRIRAIRAFSQSAGFYTGGFDRLMTSGKLEVFLNELSQ